MILLSCPEAFIFIKVIEKVILITNLEGEGIQVLGVLSASRTQCNVMVGRLFVLICRGTYGRL